MMKVIRIALGVLLATLIAGPAYSQERSAPPATPPRRIRVAGNVEEKNLLRKVFPVYPNTAMDRNLTGTVLMEVIIGVDGSVKKVKYVSGPELLKDSAMSAVKEWKYKPTMVNGEPVEVDTTVSVVYKL